MVASLLFVAEFISNSLFCRIKHLCALQAMCIVFIFILAKTMGSNFLPPLRVPSFGSIIVILNVTVV